MSIRQNGFSIVFAISMAGCSFSVSTTTEWETSSTTGIESNMSSTAVDDSTSGTGSTTDIDSTTEILSSSSTSSTTEYSTSSSTGDPPAVCGNLILEDEEECDSSIVECENCKFRNTRVFATHDKFSAALKWEKTADDICNDAANTYQINKGNYKAWLYYSIQTPFSDPEFYKSSGPYTLLNGQKLANNFSEFYGEKLMLPIIMDETLNKIQDENLFVWTGVSSLANGETHEADPPEQTCMDWSSADSNFIGGVINIEAQSLGRDTIAIYQSCDKEFRLICVEQLDK